jgi:hypothetical protein
MARAVVWIRVLGMVGGVFWMGSTVAQTPSSSPVGSEPSVTVNLADPDEKAFVWRSLRLQVSLKTGTVATGVGFKSVTLSVPPVMGIGVAAGADRAGKIELLPQAVDLRNAGETWDLPIVELDAQAVRALGADVFTMLLYRPRKEFFIVTANYELLADRTQRARTTKLDVPVGAHPLGMYAGALVGSLLAAVFVVVSRVARRWAPPANAADGGDKAPQPSVGEFAGRFIRGSVATGIAVLLFQTTADVGLPVSIKVHDFYGGVLLASPLR